MNESFRENTHTSDVNSPEINTPIEAERQDSSGLPSVSDLKEKLQEFFHGQPAEILKVPEEEPLEPEQNGGILILEDGTTIKIPDAPPLPPVHALGANDIAAPSGIGNGEASGLNGEKADGADSASGKAETERQELSPNSTYNMDGVVCKTDDNGDVYMSDGKLSPNSTYELNGSTYTADSQGRIVGCEAKPQRSPENPRDHDAQRDAGGEDRKPNDQGGHIVGRDLNGDGGGGNLVAMDSKINQSDYKRMENDVKSSLDEGKDVTTATEISYAGDSERPDKITVTVTADGKETIYKFDNNMDGALRNEVPENGKEIVQMVLDETCGEISSIKEKYDEDGNLTKAVVNITYTDEDGTAHRRKVDVDNTTGGERE